MITQKDEMDLGRLKVLTCTVPGTISSIHSVVKDVVCYFKTYYGTMDECTLFELRVILNELVLNAVKHGNKEDDGKCVVIVAGITKNEDIFLVVKDAGEGYDYKCIMQQYENLEDSLIDISDIKETGRGILIVKSLCDRIRFNKKGNKVMVVKKMRRQ